DEIPTLFLKNCAISLALPFYLIFCNSVRTNTFPAIWKEANITPILKSGSPYLPQNYRPVSLLSSVSKILERFVYKNMFAQCKNLNILHDSQHGFLSGRSCLTNLLHTYEQVSSLIDKGIPC